MRISISIGSQIITATLNESETAKDFASLLPLSLTMSDLFQREKYAHLPRAISDRGKRTKTYEVGEVVYWSPGPDVAIFYRHDAQSIPDPGIIVMGKVDSSLDALNAPGSVQIIGE